MEGSVSPTPTPTPSPNVRESSRLAEETPVLRTSVQARADLAEEVRDETLLEKFQEFLNTLILQFKQMFNLGDEEAVRLAETPAVQQMALNRMRATSMQKVAGVGDSVGVGMHSAGFDRISAVSGRRTSGHLEDVRRLLSSGETSSTNTDSFIINGAGNNFSSREFSAGAVERAVADFGTMVDILLQAGIQPVVCTMFESISDNSEQNRQMDQATIDNHPRIRAIRQFNQGIRSLAASKNIPLIDMHSLTPENSGYAIHPGRAFYTKMVNLIQSSLIT